MYPIAEFQKGLNRSSFKEQEMTGMTALMERARDYAIQKMKNSAAERGANAILGIDAEASKGEEFMHVTIYLWYNRMILDHDRSF